MIDPSLKLELTLNPGTLFLGNGGIEKWLSPIGGHIFIQDTVANKPQLRADGLSFDSADILTPLSDSNIFNLGLSSAPFTFNFWLNTADTSFALFGRWGGLDGWDGTTGWQYFITYSAGSFQWNWWNGSAQSQIIFAVTLADSIWHHIEMAFDGSTTRVYIDGLYKAALTAAYGKPSSATGFGVGQRRVGEPASFVRLLADIRIYNTCLHTTIGFFVPPMRSQFGLSMPPAPPIAFIPTALINQFDSGD